MPKTATESHHIDIDVHWM